MATKEFPIEASHILMFARAVGDENPVYTDAEAAHASETGGIIAPPTFVAASAQFDPDFFLRPKPGQRWFGSGKHPSGLHREPPAETSGTGKAAGAGETASAGETRDKPAKSGAAAGGLHAVTGTCGWPGRSCSTGSRRRWRSPGRAGSRRRGRPTFRRP